MDYQVNVALAAPYPISQEETATILITTKFKLNYVLQLNPYLECENTKRIENHMRPVLNNDSSYCAMI